MQKLRVAKKLIGKNEAKFYAKKNKKTLKIKQRITKESQNTNTTLNTAKTKDKNVKIP